MKTAGELNMKSSDFEITDGYVSEMGKSYETATDQMFSDTVALAAKLNGISEDAVLDKLWCGKSVKLHESPNYYYDHSHGEIRMMRQPKQVEVKCNCGHTVAKNMVMNASLGTSCPDCYDSMSD